MQFEIDRALFNTAIALASRAVATRSSLPILGNLLIEATDRAVKVSGTNLEVGIEVTVPATVTLADRTSLQAERLREFVGALAAPRVAVALDTKNLTATVKGGRATAKIRCLDPYDFPAITPAGDAPLATLPAARLAEALSATLVAVAKDESRPILNCLHAEFAGETLILSGVDGFRAAVTRAALAGPAREDLAVNIPAKVAQEIARALGTLGDAPVDVYIAGARNLIAVKTPTLTITGRLADGSFPDWRTFHLANVRTTIVAPRAALIAATKVVAAARDVNSLMTIATRRYDDPASDAEPADALVLTVDGDNGNTSEDEIGAVVTGDQITISLNSDYLLHALNVIGGERVKIETQSAQFAFTVAPVEGDAQWHLIMPMFVGAEKRAADRPAA